MNVNPFIDLITTILSLYGWALIIYIVLSLLISFNIVNPYQPFIQKLNMVLYRITEPVLRYFRRFLPDLAGIDLSPIIVFILIQFIKNIMYTYFYTYQ